MTNGPSIANMLNMMCSHDHNHVKLEAGNRTRKSEVYPDKLCQEIVRGLKKQMESDGRAGEGHAGSVCAVDREWTPEDESERTEIEEYWDDMSGQRLDPAKVRAARQEEMREFMKHGVYVKVPIEECWKTTGR